MTLNNRVVSILERVILRGIEGIIGDKYLEGIALGGTDHMYDFFESKCMAEQVYAQWHGWGL